MAKRSRDDVAAGRSRGLRRRPDDSDTGAVDTLDRDDTTQRRRIAGERRPAASETPSDQETGKPAVKDGEPDSQTLARDSTAKTPSRARVSAPLWAALTGLIVGGVLTGLVYAGMQTFQAIYNTPAGGGVGAVVLAVVLVVAVLIGRYLLNRHGLRDPSATSLLAVLLVVIVTLGVLLPIVFSAWMLLITPLLGAAAYLASHLLVTRIGTQH